MDNSEEKSAKDKAIYHMGKYVLHMREKYTEENIITYLRQIYDNVKRIKTIRDKVTEDYLQEILISCITPQLSNTTSDSFTNIHIMCQEIDFLMTSGFDPESILGKVLDKIEKQCMFLQENYETVLDKVLKALRECIGRKKMAEIGDEVMINHLRELTASFYFEKSVKAVKPVKKSRAKSKRKNKRKSR